MHQVSPYRAEFESLAESRSRRAASFLPESDLLFARQIRSGLSDSLSKVELYQRVSRSGNSPVQIVIRSDLASPLSFSNGLFGFLFQGRFVPESTPYILKLCLGPYGVPRGGEELSYLYIYRGTSLIKDSDPLGP